MKKAPQKLFCDPGDVETSRVKVTKVFCGAFLQKSDLLLYGASAIGNLYSATAALPGLHPGPTPAEEHLYRGTFPYYAELCALSEIRKKPGFEVPLRSGIGGHSLLYLNGVRRVRAAGYPELELCGPTQGVGISVNSHYRNANWVAADGPDFLWHGALSPGENLTLAAYARTQDRAKSLGILDGIEFQAHFFREKPPAMPARDYMYELSVGTDYAACFGRDVFRARIPLDRARMAAVVDYLNGLNAPYRDGAKTFTWKLFTDNCCHVAHNALAAAGVWSSWPTGKLAALAAFNFPVPKNEFVDLVLRADELPASPGALVLASPAIRENAVYDIDRLKLIFYDNPFWGVYRRRLRRILTQPRFMDLRENLRHFTAANLPDPEYAAKTRQLLERLDEVPDLQVESLP